MNLSAAPRIAPPDGESLVPARWWIELPSLARRYRQAQPFPHVHLRDFLDGEVARQAAREFPRPHQTEWIQYKHINEKKLGKTDRDAFPSLLGRLVDELNSPHFVAWLSALTGIDGLVADPTLEGGGLHQTERGGFLNIHADFTHHHHQPTWRRRVNLLLYLNEGWEPGWGGALELWTRDMKSCGAKYLPLLNHAVIFTTTEDSFHGLPEPLACPDGVTRKSIALYYFTPEKAEQTAPRSTYYRPRPTDELKRSLLIWLDNKALAAYSFVKRELGLSDRFASNVLRWLNRRSERK